jgi:hypothetical protein
VSSLPSPRLDDRSFADLVAAARARIAERCPEWTDLGPSDPGMTLVEVQAYLTEILLYRVNRVPEKVYVELLRLLGVTLEPPAAASVQLTFSVARPAPAALEIPRGTRVAAKRGEGAAEPVVFTTVERAVLAVGTTEVDVPALAGERVEGELAGHASGQPGQRVVARRPPIVAPTGDPLDLVVAVEALPEELTERAPALTFEGKRFRVWREVESWVEVGDDPFAYRTDRANGAVQFTGDAGLAAVPPAGREIRLWYRRGGGAAGNVAAGQLTTLQTPLPGVSVTNRQAARGGRDGETLESALARGPLEFRSLSRAVTASDFELLALKSSGAVARAKAFTRAAIWTHAVPGTVGVLLVPAIAEADRPGGRLTAEQLAAAASEEARARIAAALDLRRPLGTQCTVEWAHTKSVAVALRVVAHREENLERLAARVRERLYRTLSPLPSESFPGWHFGQALRASHLYDIVLKEPGVAYVDRVRFRVAEVPDVGVTTITPDAHQPRVWYAGAGEGLYRSTNDAEGWERVAHFPGGEVVRVAAHRERAGLVAAVVRQGSASSLHLSEDCGGSWREAAQLAFAVHDVAWLLRQGAPVVLLASAVGLYELALLPGASPLQLQVDAQDPDQGFWAVAVSTSVRGETAVAVAAYETRGVWLSSQGGASGSFKPAVGADGKGLAGQDVRVLAVLEAGVRSFLWAGVASEGNAAGQGAFAWELREMGQAPPEGWRAQSAGWQGGSCWGLAFGGTQALAASHSGGVLRWDLTAAEPRWQGADVASGLPLRDTGRFQPVRALAADGPGRTVLAGGAVGVLRTVNGGQAFEGASAREFTEKVTLPEDWLLCSGEHELEVVSEDETR